MDYHGTSAPDNKELAALIGREKRERSKTYKEISDESKAANISADVAFQTKGLIAAAGKNRVDLNDLDDVKRRVISYMDACTEAAAIPSFIGLCTHGLGLSRAAVYKYLTAHSGTATAEFIELTRDTLADILCSAALRRDADNSTAIFILKNSHNFRDRLELEAVPPADPLSPVTDPAERRRRIEAAVVDEE